MGKWVSLGSAATLLLVLAPVILIVVVFGGADSAATTMETGQACTVTGAAASGSNVGQISYSSEQVTNARTIVAVAAARGIPAQGSIIALATGMVESNLRNLDYGDRDSLGVFQQRPSQGWGTPAQVMDVAYAAGTFFDHLLRVPNWQTLPPGDAAQTVQGSAVPGAYALRVAEATALYAALGGAPGVSVQCTSNGPTGHGASVIVARATQELGLPYCYAGGNSSGPTKGAPTNGSDPGPNGLSPGCDDQHPGFDCSGLTLYALAGVGITVPHLAASQYTAAGGTQVPVASAQAGDLLFWSSDGTQAGIHHVAISLGGNQLIEAPQDGEFVSTRTWNTSEGELMPYARRFQTGAVT